MTERILIALGIVVITAIGFVVGEFRYNECMAVGHSKLYCVLDAGRR